VRELAPPLVLALAVIGGCGDAGEEREAGTEPNAPWTALERRAAERGIVPVIVTLDVEIVPEGELAPDEREAQQQRIADEQNALLEELQGTRVESVTAFTPVPQVAMSVDVDALAVLRESSRVRSVAEDVPLPPS
jgi:hypothetical protein